MNLAPDLAPKFESAAGQGDRLIVTPPLPALSNPGGGVTCYGPLDPGPHRPS